MLRKSMVSLAASVGLAALSAEPATAQGTLNGQAPIVIAHRGASGIRPEHTIEAYTKAIELGADFIEPDLVMTKDGHLIARHDNILDFSTNVRDVAMTDPEIAALKTTKSIDGGAPFEGYFSEDFTLTQIQKLKATERRVGEPPVPFRPANAAYDNLYDIPTLQQVIDLAKAQNVGIYPETKHPTHFANNGLDMNQTLVNVLHANYSNAADEPVFIQSFEIENLKQLDTMTNLPLVQLFWLPDTKAFDVEQAGGTLTYGDMATPQGLAEIATYADGVGPEKYSYIIPLDANNHLTVPTSFVADAHNANLLVHPFTFRAENRSLPDEFRIGVDPLALGDSFGEMQAFFATGIDGFFSDQTDIGRAAVDAFVPEPAGAALLAIGGLAAVQARRRRA